MRTIKGFITVLSIMLATSFALSAQTNLTSLDGKTVNVEGQTGKIVVLAIGMSWLPLSGKQSDITNALVKKYQGKNVVFYFVATDSVNPKSKNFATDEAIRKFASTNKLGIAVLRDPDGEVTVKKYDIDQMPSFVILNKSGIKAGDPFGGISTDGKYDLTIPLSKAIDKLF